ncbi:hypothetical protein NL676_014937 [Syzygium grande]|nr:hypothetical protein NL676_014937 [Syzygium grande]
MSMVLRSVAPVFLSSAEASVSARSRVVTVCVPAVCRATRSSVLEKRCVTVATVFVSSNDRLRCPHVPFFFVGKSEVARPVLWNKSTP